MEPTPPDTVFRLREPVKKVEISTLGGGGPDRGIFHTFFQNKKKKKLCLNCILSHFKPF